MANLCEKCTHRNVCRYQEPCEECNQFAEEVVRCKDCKQWDEIKHGYGWCCLDKTQHKFAKEEEFCSFGERKNDV